MNEVPNYAEYLKNNRPNIKPDGFDFDVNTFENLIDAWTPIEDIPMLLRCNHSVLDAFCNIVYKMDFTTTYNFLLGVSKMFMRKTFSGLARQGNATACSVVAKSFLKVDDDKSQNVNVTFVNDLPDNNKCKGDINK